MEKTVKIQLAGGLEARPVAMLVQLASKYDSTIYLLSEGKKVNAKSIMGMMSLKLRTGDELVVSAEGKDDAAAIADIENYLAGETK